MTPEQFTTQFTGSGFELIFDEYIQVKDFNAQLIISPPLNKPPEYKLRGKKLTITWQDTLQPNTTYQFNFGTAISDVNEGNEKDDLIYVFSTGSYIDSLAVLGRVVNAKTNEPVPKASVMLYTENLDSLPLTVNPNYFGVTDEEGYFAVRYLPDASYKIFSLFEESKNYRYNGPPEIIAFQDSLVQSSLNDSVPQMTLAAFTEKDTSQYIASEKGVDYGYYELVFNRPTENLTVDFVESETGEKLEATKLLNPGRDTLKNWVKLPERDDLEEILVMVEDGDVIGDTLYWYIETDEKFKEKPKLQLKTNTSQQKMDLNTVFSIRFNTPIVEQDTSLVFFLEDSVEVYPNRIEMKDLNRTALLHYTFNRESQYIFKAYAGAFRGFFGAYNDTVSIPFSLQDSEFYGSLNVDVEMPDSIANDGPKILQFLSGDEKVLREDPFENEISTTYTQLQPGEYKLKVIFDANNNGEYDTGNYAKKIQPEKVSIYPEPIDIRSNWEFDVEWTPTTPFDQIVLEE